MGFCVADNPTRTSGRSQSASSRSSDNAVAAALVAGDGVDLVDDHAAHIAQHLPPDSEPSST